MSSAGSELQGLIERCNRGDQHAWEEFYARHQPMIAAAVRKKWGAKLNDVEDLIQEVFINLFRALKNYDPARSIEAYVLEIVRRVSISRYRKDSASKRGGANPAPIPLNTHDSEDERGCVVVASPIEDQETSLMREQENRLLRRALAAISEQCRALLGLRYDEGLSYAEISALLGVKTVTLRSQVQRCLASLSRSYTASPSSTSV